MSNNINSFSGNMNQVTRNAANTLALMQAQQEALTTNDTFQTFDYEGPDGKKVTYQLPSFDSVVNRLRAVEESVNSLQNGYGTISLDDGTVRTLTLSSVPKTPERITGLEDPSTFTVDSNWFFEELMFPGARVSVDLTGQIEDTADRVRVVRIILDATDTAAQTLWENTLSTVSYDYSALKSLLSANGVAYSEDDEIVDLPLVRNTVSGTFTVIEDPILVSGNVWYQLDTLEYSTVGDDGTNQGQNNILSFEDTISYGDSIFQIQEVDQNLKRIRIRRISGVSQPGVYSQFSFYQNPFSSKVVEVRFGAHEYDIIYFRGIAENYNLVGNTWSTPVKFSTDELVLSGTSGLQETNFAEYYARYIFDWGSKLIAEAKENRVSAWYGKVPNAPTLNSDDFRVVQINTQINAAIDTTDVKNTAAEIESVKSQISSLKSTIAAQKTEAQSAESLYRFNSIQQQIATNTVELNNLQTTYSTLVSSFQTTVRENSALTTEPKYHIRGFFPVPDYKYKDESSGEYEEIIGFDIAYRYIKEDSTATQLNTFSYTAPDGTEYTGTFTDWNIIQGPMKSKVYDESLGRYVWKAENIADGTETNINQIDIAISKGEKVEIRVRSISEAGWPENPLRSAWSNSIIMSFPPTLATGNEIADLITRINDDALTLTIQNNLDSIGVTTHLSDTIANTNSVDVYFKHTAKYIAVEREETTEQGTKTKTSVSLQEYLDDMLENVTTALSDSGNASLIVTQYAEKAEQKYVFYDAKVSELESGVQDASQRIRDVSTDMHSFAKIKRDDEGVAHPELTARKFVIVDQDGTAKVSLIESNGRLKVSNSAADEQAAPSSIYVSDVVYRSGSDDVSLSMKLSKLDASIQNIDASLPKFGLDVSIKNSDSSIIDIKSTVSNASTRIKNLETSLGQIYKYNDQQGYVSTTQVQLTQNEAAPVVLNNNGGNLKIGGNGRRNVEANDFETESGVTLSGVNQSVTTLSGTVDTLSSTVDTQGALFGSVIHKDSSDGVTISNVKGVDAESINATDVVFGKMSLASGTVFEPHVNQTTDTKVEGHFSNVVLYGGGSNQITFDVM